MKKKQTQSMSPEERRRRSLPRKVLYSVDRAAPEVQRAFLLKTRWSFTALLLFSLSLPIVPAVLPNVQSWPESWRLWMRAGLLGAALLSLLGGILQSGRSGRRLALLPIWSLGLGMLLALSIPTHDPKAASTAALTPLLIIGMSSLGYGLNTLIFRKELKPWTEFLATGPWLLGSSVMAAYLFNASDWLLAASGLSALLLLLCMHRGGRETMRGYQASEWLWACFDTVPAACLATVSSLAGRR